MEANEPKKEQNTEEMDVMKQFMELLGQQGMKEQSQDFMEVLQYIAGMDYANSYLESMGVAKVPTYKHYDFDKMIEETKPDTVIVTSVDRTHDYYIIRAMELGCNVITEKPMTIDEKRAQAIIDAQKRTGKEVRVSFNYRYAPHNTKVLWIL